MHISQGLSEIKYTINRDAFLEEGIPVILHKGVGFMHYFSNSRLIFCATVRWCSINSSSAFVSWFLRR